MKKSGKGRAGHHGKYGGKAKPGNISGKSKHAAGPLAEPSSKKRRSRKSEFGG